MSKYLIMGAGNQAFAMASQFVKNGHEVNIWNMHEDTIKKIKETKVVKCNGVIEGEFQINNVSTNIDDVLCDVIFVTTPATGHKPIAQVLAKKVCSDNTIIITPGRTFGIIEFTEELKRNGCESLPKIAETQTILYTCRKSSDDSVNLYALKDKMLISSVNNKDLDYILSVVPKCYSEYLIKADSFIQTSLGNVGMLLHCAPVLMNVGWIESKNDFSYYKEGISPTVAHIVEKLDKERLEVATKLGFNVESVTDWMRRIYNCDGKDLFEVIQNNNKYNNITAPTTLNYRYLDEDIPFGLVPLESIAKKLNINVKITTLLIDLACEIMEKDYRKEGRIIENINKYICVEEYKYEG